MTRPLIAGVGNIFFGDDGFGVEVARHLTASPPPNATVTDFGIRAIHLAYDLIEAPLCIVIDCMSRGGEPGTLYVVEPDTHAVATIGDAHGMNLDVVFSAARELGGQLPPVLVVGCEPAGIAPGLGLSPIVASAVPAAVQLVRDLLAERIPS